MEVLTNQIIFIIADLEASPPRTRQCAPPDCDLWCEHGRGPVSAPKHVTIFVGAWHFILVFWNTDLDHPGDLHADQPGVGGGLAVEGEAAPPPVNNHNIDILRGDQGSGHVLTDKNIYTDIDRNYLFIIWKCKN